MRALGAFVVRVGTWFVLLGAVGLLAVAVLVPRVSGATPYAVLTGSMEPDLPPGTLVVVRPAEPGSVAVGDVVTYQLASGESTVVTHRIVEVQNRIDGEVRYRTQGDANPVPDRALVRPEQVRGEVWYGLPWVGHLNQAMDAHARSIATVLVAGSLALYALVMFAGAWRERRGHSSSGSGKHAAPRSRARVKVPA